MALGTITKPSGASDYDIANKRVRVRDIQLTSGANYTTGGETITAASVGLNTIFEAIPLGLALPTGGATSRTVGFIYSAPNVKMVVHTTASAEAVSNTDQSTFTVRVRFVGR
jgi:hypothetical protein